LSVLVPLLFGNELAWPGDGTTVKMTTFEFETRKKKIDCS